jgi:photosystem II stability/assembly factor-like uncharacterized protein
MPAWLDGSSRKALLYAGSVLLLALTTWSAGADYALVMPKARNSLLLDIATAGNRLVAVGERGHILYSKDKGQTWVQAKVPTSVMLTRVFFVNDRLGWAVGHDGNILVSRDGGVNWGLQRDGVTDQKRINEERAERAKQRVKTLQQRLTGSSEQERAELQQSLEEAEHTLGVAREIMHEPVYAPPLMDIWFSSEEQGWAGGAFGTLLRTSNGGRSWEDWSHKVDNPDELHLNGVAGDSVGTLYLASEWGKVFRSSSSGEFWQAEDTGYDGSLFGVVVNPVSESVFAYGLLGTIYRSNDRGRTWAELRSNTRASLFGAASAADGTLVFVGDNGTVLLSTDNGDSLIVLDQKSSRGLYGVAAISRGQIIVTGEGGSAWVTGIDKNQWQATDG